MPTPSTTIVADKLPAGIDWADGLGSGATKNLGTPSPTASVKATASAGDVTSAASIPIEELAESPTIERAEQATVTHSFIMPYAEALNRLSIYGRGSLRADSVGNYYRTLSSSVTRMKGNMARLQIVSESLSYDNPPDEFQVVPVELGVDILKHPRYFYALMPTNQIPGYSGTADTDSQAAYKQQVIRALQAYRENPVVPNDATILNIEGTYQQEVQTFLKALKTAIPVPNPNFNPTFGADDPPAPGKTFTGGLPYPPVAADEIDLNPQFYYKGYDFSLSANDPGGRALMAATAALEIMQKLWRMEDTPYVVGWQITWSSYYFRPPSLNPGGYIENPQTAIPALPDYFYSTAYPPNGSQTVFDLMASYNPQCYSSNGQYGGSTSISWLRKADEIEYQRTWFRVTRTWLGAPIGAWDGDLYGKVQRPSLPTDYRQFNFVS